MNKTIFLATLALSSLAHAYEAKLVNGESAATLEAMLSKANAETQLNFDPADFLLVEDRDLATSNYKFYVQASESIPVSQTGVRIWSDPTSGELILAEIHLSEDSQKNATRLSAKFNKAKFTQSALKSKALRLSINSLVSAEVSKHDTDNKVLGMKSFDQWVDGDLVRKVEVRGRRGIHHISVSLLKNKIVESRYSEFPQSEKFQTLKANIFPMYEEVETTHEILPYEVRELKYVNTEVTEGGENPLGSLSTVFSEDTYHPILADTQIGQENDFWSEASVRKKVYDLVAKMPVRANDFASGLLLQGKFVTIQLHPEIKESFDNINFPLKNSTNHMLSWVNVAGSWQAKPVSGILGKPATSQDELLSRVPVRLQDHDPASYINSGADEAQVYYAVTTLMDSLAQMGFTDKELSTNPFHAFLYDPDISMKDNAYYTDNTINFTTYSADQPNMARDNPTIWHELGHGVMERLMGAHLVFGDTKGGYGGLSEGMADFVAKIIVEEQTDSAPFPGKDDFRIINNIGFYLTNEFHDEGESYGGAMSDMLQDAMTVAGKDGLAAFADLTLETMRLTRNHPMLTARSWFETMIFADSLGSSARDAGAFKVIIEDSLRARNFSFSDNFTPATMKVMNGKTELTNISEASRERPLTPCSKSGKVSYNLNLSLTTGSANFIKFPATVKVEFQKGALQGAIKWDGEEANPTVYTVNSEAEVLNIPLKASMKCESINQPDGSCKDYAYIQVYNQGETKPRAKKRFYLKIKDQATCK